MVTRIGTGRRQHLYIEQHMRAKGMSDQDVANRLGVSRVTVFRWRSEQRKLTPEKIAALAEAIDIEPEEFWRMPGRPSVDALIRDADEKVVAEVIAFAAKKVVRGR